MEEERELGHPQGRGRVVRVDTEPRGLSCDENGMASGDTPAESCGLRGAVISQSNLPVCVCGLADQSSGRGLENVGFIK